jgi:hypothetical protein
MTKTQSFPETPSAADEHGGSVSHVNGVEGGNQLNLPDASAEIAFTSLLAEGLAAGGYEDSVGATLAGAHEYDGHVALALDAGVLPNIDAALDLLTSSHHLFDVPAVDLGAAADDSLPT